MAGPLDIIVEYFKGKPYWHVLEPVFTLIALYSVSLTMAYQYIEWRYHFTPDLAIFIHSYIFKQITVVFVTFVLLALVLGRTWTGNVRGEIRARFRGKFRLGARKLLLAGLIVVIAAGVFLRLSPHRVSHITVKFLEPPSSFQDAAFAYIVYELNRAQNDWHFSLDPDVFNPNSLSSTERQRCEGDRFCYAQLIAQGQPFIGITESGFEQDSFWSNSGSISVISAGQWKEYQPPSVYEYLAYSLIVQSTLIHLNRSCHGLPAGAYQASRLSYGELFEFTPRRNEMKAAILAAHLSPQGEELLTNCFGLDYMNACNRLLSLEWLHTGRVHDNLERNFGVKL